jgi:hypothetical protein
MKSSAEHYRLALRFLLLVSLGFTVIYAANRAGEKRQAPRGKPAPNTSLAPAPFGHRSEPVNMAGEPMQTGGAFEARPAVVAGGGGQSSGGNFQTEDTVGQSLVGQSSGGRFSVSDGFWGGAASCPAITVNPSNSLLPGGQLGVPYNQLFTQTGGTGTVNWSVSLGALPANLTLNAGTGVLSGAPAQSGAFNFTITATDANGCAGARSYTLTIICAFTLAPPNQSFPAGGGANSVAVTTAPGCAWTAASNDGWIRITGGASGAGPGAVNYSVDAHTGAGQRAGAMTIAGQTFTVTQAGVPPRTDVSISGNVRYCITADTLASAVLTVTNATAAVVATATSDGNGRYALGGLSPGFYLATPAKSGDVRGLSAYDAALVAQFVERGGTPPFDACRLLAADADRNSVITSADAMAILRYVVGLPDSGRTGIWRFRPEERRYPSLNGDQANQDYEAVLIGDVTGSWARATTPAITSVEMIADGNGQGLIVRGEGFQPGLSLVVIFPGGGEMRLDRSQIQKVTRGTFVARAAVAWRGMWALQVINPDGERSEAYVIYVP